MKVASDPILTLTERSPALEQYSDPETFRHFKQQAMRKLPIGFLAMALCVLGVGATWMVGADDDPVRFTAKLDGKSLGA